MIDSVVDLVEEHVDLVVLNFLNQFSNAGTLRVLHSRMWYVTGSRVVLCHPLAHNFGFSHLVVML